MNEPGLFIQFKNSRIHYRIIGNGSSYLFAFHGFSETSESFLVLEPVLKNDYSSIAIDLPFHGETQWKEPEPFTTTDLKEIIQLFLEKYAIDRFSVLGFSMGGKCALYTVMYFSEKIDTLILMASDGIRTNKIYNVAVYPAWGRELFKTTIKHPRWFFAMVRITRSLGIISPWLYKFTYNHMDTREKRQRLYDTWISMSQFNPDIEKVKQLISNNHINTLLFFGLRDEVIPPSVGRYFAEGLSACRLVELDRGHYFIDDRLRPFLQQALNGLKRRW